MALSVGGVGGVEGWDGMGVNKGARTAAGVLMLMIESRLYSVAWFV